jgi:4-hydroxybenzoate polyprenyltransferase
MNPSEDALNKPHRPIPSGRITLEDARTLRWVLAPICLAYSKTLYGDEVAYSSIAIAVLLFLYNELGGDSHWSCRDVVNAGLFAMFEVGASLVASDDRHILPNTTVKAILVNALLYATTNFSQDFKDVIGDSLVGRRTLPIVFPTFARSILLPCMVGWSLGLVALWHLKAGFAVPFVGFSVLVGWMFFVNKSAAQDKKTTKLYLVRMWFPRRQTTC